MAGTAVIASPVRARVHKGIAARHQRVLCRASSATSSTEAQAAAPQSQIAPSGRSRFRLLLAATTQATADVQAFEAWSGRFNMIFLMGALCSEVVSGGSGLFTGFAEVDVESFGVLALAMVGGGAAAAVASPPVVGSSTLEELTSAWPMRSLFSRSLTTSVLLVEDEQRGMSTVADDIYRNVLRETLDSLKVESYIDETRTETVVPDAPVEAQQQRQPMYLRSVLEDLRDV